MKGSKDLDALRFGLADVGAPIVFGLIEIAAAVFASRVLWKRRPAALRGR
jgi:hypothetical protein